jgi:hypothetical protein
MTSDGHARRLDEWAALLDASVPHADDPERDDPERDDPVPDALATDGRD